MAKDIFTSKRTLNLKGKIREIDTPLVMGILNITPDSFYDGGRYKTEERIIDHVRRMLEEGADIIDVGGCSTRPGADDIGEQQELDRVVPIITALIREFDDIVVSVDTSRAGVARAAVGAGACMVNDITGGTDADMWNTVAELRVPYVVMHTRGTPSNMQRQTDYEDVVYEVITYLEGLIHQLNDRGIADIIVDPGIGFAKTLEQNYELLRNLDYFKALERPLLVGLSRKSLIYRLLDESPEGALNGTSVLNALALMKGADILRVHDVKEASQAIKLIKKAEAI